MPRRRIGIAAILSFAAAFPLQGKPLEKEIVIDSLPPSCFKVAEDTGTVTVARPDTLDARHRRYLTWFLAHRKGPELKVVYVIDSFLGNETARANRSKDHNATVGLDPLRSSVYLAVNDSPVSLASVAKELVIPPGFCPIDMTDPKEKAAFDVVDRRAEQRKKELRADRYLSTGHLAGVGCSDKSRFITDPLRGDIDHAWWFPDPDNDGIQSVEPRMRQALAVATSRCDKFGTKHLSELHLSRDPTTINRAVRNAVEHHTALNLPAVYFHRSATHVACYTFTFQHRKTGVPVLWVGAVVTAASGMMTYGRRARYESDVDLENLIHLADHDIALYDRKNGP